MGESCGMQGLAVWTRRHEQGHDEMGEDEKGGQEEGGQEEGEEQGDGKVRRVRRRARGQRGGRDWVEKGGREHGKLLQQRHGARSLGGGGREG